MHPTYGAFWGMGIGVGCGVGWGPGYGPESVGFVGSGCGLGFSVGLTFIGFGLGLLDYSFNTKKNKTESDPDENQATDYGNNAGDL